MKRNIKRRKRKFERAQEFLRGPKRAQDEKEN